MRLVCATNANLPERVAEEKFRADLLDRLAFDVVQLPPLRERRSDIMLLADQFAIQMCRELGLPLFPGFSDYARETLLAYHWPGNIRELENLVQGLAVTSKDSVIRASDVPISGVAKPAASARRDGLDFEIDGKTYKEIMKDLENKVLSAAMERYN